MSQVCASWMKPRDWEAPPSWLPRTARSWNWPGLHCFPVGLGCGRVESECIPATSPVSSKASHIGSKPSRFGYRSWTSTGRIAATLNPRLATRRSSLAARAGFWTGSAAQGKSRSGATEHQS